MPIEIKELKVNIQVKDKSISIEEIERIVSKIIKKERSFIKEDFMNTISKNERLHKNR